jgi:hypothetical protein
MKRIFCGSAAVLMLAIAYHFGASTATAQSGGPVTVGGINTYYEGGIAGVVGRLVYTGTYRQPLALFGPSAPVPGTYPIIAVDGSSFTVMLSNGGVYTANGTGGATWTLLGNLLLHPTPALQESWGQLKSRYAPKSAPTSQAPTDR